MSSSDNYGLLYQQICAGHDGIADFRAKLLALLPIASGSALLVVLKGGFGTSEGHWMAIGLFGALIAFGLFLYELRGIHYCNSLIVAAQKLEAELRGEECPAITAYCCRPDAHPWLVSSTWAALVIYPTTIGSWIYIAAIGGKSSIPFMIALLFAAAALVFGYLVDRAQRKTRRDPLLIVRLEQDVQNLAQKKAEKAEQTLNAWAQNVIRKAASG